MAAASANSTSSASETPAASAAAEAAAVVEAPPALMSQENSQLAHFGQPEKASRSSGTRRWGKAQSAEATPHGGPQANATHPHSTSAAQVPESSPHSLAAPVDAPLHGLFFDCFAVLDFEATCDEPCQPDPQEIIELPIVLVHAASGKILKEFRSYVRPVHHRQLTAFCTQLTGITQESVDAAPSWPQALLMAEEWLDSQFQEFNLANCLFVTCGDWDLASMMGRQCALAGMHVPARYRQWLNIKNFFRKVTGNYGRGMKTMLNFLGLRFEGHHHSGLDDSRNISRILTELLRKGGVMEMDLVSSSSSSQAAGNSGKKGGRKGSKKGGGKGSKNEGGKGRNSI